MGCRVEEYTASNGKGPEGKAESQDEGAQQSLDGPGDGLEGIFVSCRAQHGALYQGGTTRELGGGCGAEVVKASYGRLRS